MQTHLNSFNLKSACSTAEIDSVQKTIAAAAPLLERNRMQCERFDPLTWVCKKICPANRVCVNPALLSTVCSSSPEWVCVSLCECGCERERVCVCLSVWVCLSLSRSLCVWICWSRGFLWICIYDSEGESAFLSRFLLSHSEHTLFALWVTSSFCVCRSRLVCVHWVCTWSGSVSAFCLWHSEDNLPINNLILEFDRIVIYFVF